MLAHVALLLVAPLLAAKPKLELQLDEHSIQTRDYCFASGLRVSFQEDHSQPVVSVTSVIDRGSDADPPGKEGIAHLVEHLWFRSQRGELPTVWDLHEEMGSSINAFTAPDVTAYMTVAPKAMLPAVLELEAARLMDAMEGVTQQTVDTEREVVRNELREGEAIDLGLAAVFGKLYPQGHPYARTTIGTRSTLDGITVQDVQDFVKDNYAPANATILVVGDLSLDDAPQLLSDHLPPELVFHPDHPEGPASAEACPVRIQGPGELPPDPADRSIEWLQAPVERPVVIMAWSLPGAWRPDTPLADLVSLTLTWAVGSYINPAGAASWRDRNEAECGLWPGEHASTALCAIELKHDADPEKVIKRAADGLYQLWDPQTRRFQDRYYNLASMHLMARIFRSADEVATLFGGRSSDTALFTHFTGSSSYYSTSFNWLGAVNGQDAAQLAHRYLNRDRYVAVVIEPFDEGSAGWSADEGYTGHPREAVTDTVLDQERIDGELVEALTVEPDLGELRDLRLDNGLRLLILPYGSVPIARTALAVRGGALHEPAPGLDRLAWDLASSEPAGLEVELEEAPLRIGGEWQDFQHGDMRVLQVNGSSANLETQLWLLRQRLDAMKTEKTDRRAYARDLRRELQYEREQPQHWAWQQARQALLGEHPLAHGLNDESIAALSDYGDEQADAWLTHMFQPANASLLLVGRFDPDEAEQAARRWFEDWTPRSQVGSAVALLDPLPDPGPRRVLVLDHPQVSQTEVSLSCQLAPAEPGGTERCEMLAAMLDELAWTSLRESAGVTYGAGAWAREYAGGPALLHMSATVQNNAAGLAASSFLDLVSRARAGDLDPDLLRLLKLGRARGYVQQQQSTDQMLRRLVEPLALDHGWDQLTEHGARLAAVQVEQLPRLVQPCAGHEVLTLVGPVEGILSQLEQAGLQAEVFDWRTERDRLWAEYDPKGWKSEQKRRAKSGG